MKTESRFNPLLPSTIMLVLGVALTARAQTLSTLHNFGSIQYDGQNPYAALAASGNVLYGAAQAGGSNGTGMIFSINNDGSSYSNLYDFSAAATSDGRAPYSRLTVSGNTLYGACISGGPAGVGTLFRVNTDGSGFTNLHNFTTLSGSAGLEGDGEGVNGDGAFPRTTLVLSGTNLYGVAALGGANGNGTVFRVSTDGKSFGLVYTFSTSPNGITNRDGGFPYGNLVLSDTTLFGTTEQGGALGNGTVYSVSIINSAFTNLHSFGGQIFGGPYSGQTDGIQPGWGLLLTGTNLYGTAQNGGGNDFGTIFMLNTNGQNYQTIYDFPGQPLGRTPLCDLVMVGTNLFGATYFGGSNANGTLFSISDNGTNTFDIDYDFAAFNNQNQNAPNPGGAHPYGGLVFSGTNLYGVAVAGGSVGYGTVFQLTVPPAMLASIPPQLQTDVQTPFYVYVGGTVSNSVTVSGPNLAYQWQFNGVNLTNNANITGAQSNVLTLSNVQGGAAGSYKVIVTNAAGSVASSVAALTVVGSGSIGFNGSGFGWTANQSGPYTAPAIASGLLTLTDGGGSEARSFFFDFPQYIGAFQASFTYQDVGGGGADGIAFVLQNDSRGSNALGADGGNLGVGGASLITPSAELELNSYTGNSENEGYTFLTDGLTGMNGANGNYHSPGSVNLASGDPINIAMFYAQGQLALTLTDAVASASFRTNVNVGNLTNIVGGATALIGFTGADGGVASTQTISNFSFLSIPIETAGVSSKNLVISWPATIEASYTLQKNGNLATTNWVAVTNQPTVVNGQNQVTVPLTASNLFYRLILP